MVVDFSIATVDDIDIFPAHTFPNLHARFSRTQRTVVLMAMISYRERTLSKMSKRQNLGEAGASFQVSPGAATQVELNPPRNVL